MLMCLVAKGIGNLINEVYIDLCVHDQGIDLLVHTVVTQL